VVALALYSITGMKPHGVEAFFGIWSRWNKQGLHRKLEAVVVVQVTLN